MRVRGWIAVVSIVGASVLSGGCAARAAIPAQGRSLPRAGGPVPEGPARTFVPSWTGIFARIDLARMRRSVNGNGYADLARLTHTYSHMLADVGLDPVEDLDSAIVISSSVFDSRTLLVLRHRSTADELRARVDREVRERGDAPRWDTVGGFRVADWPCRSTIPRRVVVTGQRELVLTPHDDLEGIVGAARDHLARAPGGAIVDPAWDGTVDGEIARIRATAGIPAHAALGGRAPLVADFLMREAGIDRTEITVDFTMADAASASAATVELRQYAGLASREPLLAGIARILWSVRVEQRGDHAIAFVRLTDEDLGSALATASLLARVWGWGS